MITGNNTPEARRLGATKLLQARTSEAARRLTEVLQANPADLAAQIAVCQAISDFERPMPLLAEPLLGLLGDERPGLEEAVIHALCRFDNGKVVERLGPLATEKTSDLEKRLSAIRALGQMGDNIQAVAVLVSLVKDEIATVRAAALASLADATGIVHPDGASVAAWWERFKAMSPRQWLSWRNDRLVEANRHLKNENEVLTLRLIASRRETYLRTPEPDRAQLLLSFLRDDLADLRALGLDLINVLITDRKEVPQDIKARLVEMLNDPIADVRLTVARMVGDLRLSGALAPLIDSVGRETDHHVRAAMVHAVGRLDDPGAVPVLIGRLDDDAPAVVGEAAMALGAIARRGHATPETIEPVAEALLRRYQAIGVEEEELRQAFLSALALMAAEPFRPVFEAELKPDRSIRIRRAAIAGLAALGDDAAVVKLRTLMKASEPEIRLAAVQALGKCGRSETDLAALVGRLDSDTEPEEAVRRRAWESVLAMARRQSPQELVSLSDRFARPDDVAAQGRRLELLRLLKASPEKFDQLPPGQRLAVLERMADAQIQLSEWAGAAANLEQAMGIMTDQAHPRYAALALRLISALLRGQDDKTALERIRRWTEGNQPDSGPLNPAVLADTVLSEVRRRLDAGMYREAESLTALSSGLVRRAGTQLAQKLEDLREEAVAKRDVVIDRLLDSLLTDPAAETRLMSYGSDVLPRLHARLTAMATTTSPSGDLEEKMLSVAKRLVPDWPGYQPGCPPAERESALEALRARWTSQKPPAAIAPVGVPTTVPSS